MSADTLTKREQIAASTLNAMIAVYCRETRSEIFDSGVKRALAKAAVVYADELLLVLAEMGVKK